MNNQPKITVFIAVYNGQKYLKEAIDSILNQTFKNFELLIINDGSSDDSVKIIESYRDPRLRLLHNEKNLGIVETRNRGLKKMKGEYLAVLDCDDIAPARRLEKQLRFLEKNKDFGLVGGQTQIINAEGWPTGTVWKNAYPPEKFPATLLFTCCISHPAVMIRTSALPSDGYRNFGGACDYDLWQRMTQRWKIWNLPEIMVKYRIHGQNMTLSDGQRQKDFADEVRKIYLADLNIYPSTQELMVHRTNHLFKMEDRDPLEFLEERNNWLQKIKKANGATSVYAEPVFSQVLADRWLISCSANAVNCGKTTWKKYWQSSLISGHKKNWRQLLLFAARSLLRIQTKTYF